MTLGHSHNKFTLMFLTFATIQQHSKNMQQLWTWTNGLHTLYCFLDSGDLPSAYTLRISKIKKRRNTAVQKCTIYLHQRCTTQPYNFTMHRWKVFFFLRFFLVSLNAFKSGVEMRIRKRAIHLQLAMLCCLHKQYTWNENTITAKATFKWNGMEWYKKVCISLE